MVCFSVVDTTVMNADRPVRTTRKMQPATIAWAEALPGISPEPSFAVNAVSLTVMEMQEELTSEPEGRLA